ncbi:MAG TPA: hypothetical protein VKA34_01250 [Balneolales bacterium]|nr:hypothetical protein [Balneolales bacterium]
MPKLPTKNQAFIAIKVETLPNHSITGIGLEKLRIFFDYNDRLREWIARAEAKSCILL